MVSRYTTSLVIALLLLASLGRAAARPQPADPKINDQQEVVDEASFETMDERCGGLSEECLMRRTLVAHTDYIYTQGKEP